MKQLARLLDESEVNYCILHGWQSLPEHLPSDLDIVVAPTDLARLEEALVRDDTYMVVQVLQHEVTCFYFVLAVDDGREVRFVPLDVATAYRRNGQTFLAAEELLAERRYARGLWVAAPRAEFGYLLAKKIAKRSLPVHQWERLRSLLVELAEEGELVASRLLGLDSGTKATAWIRSDDRAAFECNLGQLRIALGRQASRRAVLNPIRTRLFELQRIWRRWRYPTGLFVAVLGPDGAGKSTLIAHLQRRLAGAFRQTETFHFRPGLLSPASRLTPTSKPHAEPNRSWTVSVLKALHYVVDFSLGYVARIRPGLVHSTLVLADRYYDDLSIDPRRYRYGGPTWLVGLLLYFVPRPDLFLILDLSPDRILERKQEVPLGEMHRQRRAYVDLAKKLPNAVLLDGTQPVEDVAYQAAQVVLKSMHERYLMRRRGSFAHCTNDASTLNHLRWLQGVLLFESESSGKEE